MEQFIGLALRMESEGEPCIVPTMTPKKGEEETADKESLKISRSNTKPNAEMFIFQ